MASLDDRPWARPGRIAYARKRIRSVLRPPVTVYPTPEAVMKDYDVPVTMRDGITLRLNVYRPRGAGPFPVVMSAHPYGKDVLPKQKRKGYSFSPQYRIMNQPQPVRFSDQTSWEAPDPAWWVRHGYAVVNADTRGGGHSEGVGDLFSDQEAEDIAELIQWAGTQPWSNGSVGMLGVSYLALSQYKVAALNPPHLKAICPWEGFTDPYRDFFTPGGIPEGGFSKIWLANTQKQVRLRTNLAAERVRHVTRDEWWESLTPDIGRIRMPILVCTSFSDNNLHSTGSMRLFQRAGSEHVFAFQHRGPKWSTFYSEEAGRAQLHFFDRFLRDQDIPLPPKMRLELRDRADHIVETRTENEWPLQRAQWRRLHLGNDGTLSEDPTPDETPITFDLRRTAVSFRYTFEEETEASGPMNLTLHVSASGTDDPFLFVGVEKWAARTYIPFEGSYGYGRDPIAIGRHRVAFRELDAQLSRPHQPEHTFTRLEPLGPDEIVEVQIPLTSSATVFHPGETLRLVVAGRYLEPRNPFFGHFPTRYRPSPAGTCTIYAGGNRGSALEVPIT